MSGGEERKQMPKTTASDILCPATNPRHLTCPQRSFLFFPTKWPKKLRKPHTTTTRSFLASKPQKSVSGLLLAPVKGNDFANSKAVWTRDLDEIGIQATLERWTPQL